MYVTGEAIRVLDDLEVTATVPLYREVEAPNTPQRPTMGTKR